MDVHCSTCREPWDTYHLWHDAIWETGLDEAELREWEKLPQSEKLARHWHEEFEMAGYVFGRTGLNDRPGEQRGSFRKPLPSPASFTCRE